MGWEKINMKKNYLVAALFFLAFVAIGLVWTCKNIADYDEYRRLEGIAVSVNATVTRVEDSYDEDSPYRLFISYEHAGVAYTDVFYADSTRSDMLGQTLTIQVDPAHPTARRPKDPGALLPTIACLFIAPAGYAFLLFLSTARALEVAEKRWASLYDGGVISADKAREDVLFERERKRRLALWLLAAVTAVTLAGCGLYAILRGTMTAFYGFLPPLALIALGLLLFTRVGEVQVTLQETQITKIVKAEDSDGSEEKRTLASGFGQTNVSSCTLVSLQGRDWAKAGKPGAGFYVAVVGRSPERFYSKDEFRLESGAGD